MSPEVIFGIGVAVVVVVGLISKLIPKRMPPSRSFKCGRCGVQALHTNRTAEAWRNGKTRFFCQSCHHKWLQSRPPQERESYRARGSSRHGSGCLGVVVLCALVPIGMWVAWACV
jgi:DNA-directed RNA polymerase subunit RPC12/RpoP